MGRYSRESDNVAKSCKARGPNLRVHFKVRTISSSPEAGKQHKQIGGPEELKFLQLKSVNACHTQQLFAFALLLEESTGEFIS